MYKVSGSISGWLPVGTPLDVERVQARLLARLKAEGATRLSCTDGVIRFDGGSGQWNVDPLKWIDTGELRVQGVAPDLAAYRAADVKYRVRYALRTPVVLVLTLMFGIFLGGLFGLKIGTLPAGLVAGAIVASLYTLVFGGLWSLMVRVSFREFLRDAMVEPTAAASAREANSASAASREPRAFLHPSRVTPQLTPRERAIVDLPARETPPEPRRGTSADDEER